MNDAAKKARGYKWPKSLGSLADHLYTLREQRLAVQKQADIIKAEEDSLAEHILLSFPKQDLEGARGKLAQVTRSEKDVPKVTDWDALYAHIKKTGAFELLQKRPTESAFAERWEAGKTVPGTEKFTVVKLSVSKVAA